MTDLIGKGIALNFASAFFNYLEDGNATSERQSMDLVFSALKIRAVNGKGNDDSITTVLL